MMKQLQKNFFFAGCIKCRKLIFVYCVCCVLEHVAVQSCFQSLGGEIKLLELHEDLGNGNLAQMVLMRIRLVVRKKEKVVWYPSS